MQSSYLQNKLTIVEQACEKVPGFSVLNQQVKQKMSINGYSTSTFINYSRHLAAITIYHDCLPTLLNSNEINDYLYHLQQKFNSHSETYFKLTVYSLRFVFKMAGLMDMHVCLPKIKRIKKLPVVLSKHEMVNMLNKPRLLKHRVLIALLYGCGLRCFEVRNIKLNDIDLHRSVVHIRQGKGKKDRYMPLGNSLTLILKKYIEIYKPLTWLFTGRHVKDCTCEFDRKCSQRGVQWAVHSAAKIAGITKQINVHTLRHTFATHMLEDGLDIISIKELLGHSSIETTLIYLHIAQISRKDKFSPIDNLQGIRVIQGVQCIIDFSNT